MTQSSVPMGMALEHRYVHKVKRRKKCHILGHSEVRYRTPNQFHVGTVGRRHSVAGHPWLCPHNILSSLPYNPCVYLMKAKFTRNADCIVLFWALLFLKEQESLWTTLGYKSTDGWVQECDLSPTRAMMPFITMPSAVSQRIFPRSTMQFPLDNTSGFVSVSVWYDSEVTVSLIPWKSKLHRYSDSRKRFYLRLRFSAPPVFQLARELYRAPLLTYEFLRCDPICEICQMIWVCGVVLHNVVHPYVDLQRAEMDQKCTPSVQSHITRIKLETNFWCYVKLFVWILQRLHEHAR